MFSSKKSIIILVSIIFFSCGENTPTEVNNNIIDSSILEQTDSLLNIVDEEFQHIIHDSEVKNEKVNTLQDRVERYRNVIVLDKREQNLLIVKIDSLRMLCSEKDSLNKDLTLQIESKNSTIKSIEKRERIIKGQMKEQVILYESIIYHLEDSLSNYIIESKIIDSENKRRKRNKKQ
jgi:hypothetical protein